VDGTVDAPEFGALALGNSASFKANRWFCDDDELIHVNGKTYAFSSQWGGDDWRNAMNALKAQYPQFNIDFIPAT
jgi:hypothetical protein